MSDQYKRYSTANGPSIHQQPVVEKLRKFCRNNSSSLQDVIKINHLVKQQHQLPRSLIVSITLKGSFWIRQKSNIL